MHLLSDLVHRLGDMPAGGIYLVAGVLLAAEVGLLFGLFVPAATTMITVGALARHGHVQLPTALLVLTAAAALGDNLGYLEGRLLGPRLRRARISRRIGAARWERAQAFLDAHGGAAIILGRWTAFVRTLVRPVWPAQVGCPTAVSCSATASPSRCGCPPACCRATS